MAEIKEDDFMDGQDLINAAVGIGTIEDPEKRAAVLAEWDAMFADNCDVMFCIGKKSDGHAREGIHYDATGTSFYANGQIIHTYHDPMVD